MAPRGVPLVRRQLLREPARIVAALAAVAAAVALVLVLSGLRRGMGEQVTTYLDRQAPVLVGARGVRGFIGHSSLIPEQTTQQVARVAGVAGVAPISHGFAMLSLHGKRVLTLLIGSDPGAAGGPWRLSEGRRPRLRNDLVLDRILAGEHDLEVGSTLRFRGATLRIVGLSIGTSGFMTPLAFTTRQTVNELNQQPRTVTFLLVQPTPGVDARALARRIESEIGGITATHRDELARADRELYVGAFAEPLLAMVVIAGAVAVLVISITVYGSIHDRTREYATLKAIGLGRGALLRLASTHALALALGGAMLGMVLAELTSQALDQLAPKYLIALSAVDIAAMAVASVGFALAAAAFPTRYLLGVDPASAFRA